MWNEGRRLLVSQDAEGKLMTIQSRQAEVRRPLMAAKPMAQQGHCVCFGPDRAFAYKIEPDRVIPFESTPNGWNLTVELEVTRNHGHHDDRETLRTDGENRTREGTASRNQTNVDWTKGCVFFTTFWMAGHRLVRPQERSLEPLTETDGDETMMYNPGDDDAGETSAVKSKIQPMRPSDQVIATQVVTIRIVIGAALVLVALGGQTLPNDGMKSRTFCL